MSGKKSTTNQNLWDALFREKVRAVNAYTEKEERSQIGNLTLHTLGNKKKKSKLEPKHETKEIVGNDCPVHAVF